MYISNYMLRCINEPARKIETPIYAKRTHLVTYFNIHKLIQLVTLIYLLIVTSILASFAHVTYTHTFAHVTDKHSLALYYLSVLVTSLTKKEDCCVMQNA